MSKQTQIEQALQAIDPAGFQRLCDAYLYARGFRNINPIGLVIGADKVKRGSPDSLVTLPGGNYLFAEYTTQKTGIVDKFLDDMAKCFDETKTGIPVNRIQHFVACHTSVLDADDQFRLEEEGRRRGCLISVFGLGPITQDLVQRFPGLAREHLHVDLDTGQILTLDDFVSAYGKNAVATPLDTQIRFRDNEIERALRDLESNDLLILAGPAGVGKSRLALEICRRFAEQTPDVDVRGILYRGPDLFADVRTYFATPGTHVVFVDDANRVSGFEHILHLLHEQRDDRRVKIIATVRDYALDKVRDNIRQYGSPPVLMLGALKDDQIREILTKDFGIANHEYYERIVEVAQGNPRLAVMAARLAKTEQKLSSLANVFALYDEYYRSIRQDIANLQDAELLRAAGIVAVFRHVDKKNDEQMAVIADAFGMSADRLWPAVTQLHDLEVIDVYETEVARISDQVLATYLFHLAFFGDRVLDPAAFFHPRFFPRYKSRLFDALNPAASAFDGQAITNEIRPPLMRRWNELEAARDEEALLHFVTAFGSIEETATLTFLRDRIAALSSEAADLSKITFKPATSSGLSLWTVLGTLARNELTVVRMALGLALDLVAKRPGDVPEALYLLTDRLGMKLDSYRRDFEVQRATCDALWNRVRDADANFDPLFVRLFVLAVEPLLHTEFRTHESKSDTAVTITTFNVPTTPGLVELRQSIWRRLGELLGSTETHADGLEVVREHSRGGFHVLDEKLLASDAAVSLDVLTHNLDPANYADCAALQEYLQLLQLRHVVLDEPLEKQRANLQNRFGGPTYQLGSLLLEDFADLHGRAEIGWEEYEKEKRQRLGEYVAQADLAQLDKLISECVTIREELQAEQTAQPNSAGVSHRDWQLKQSLTTMLQTVAERDAALFEAFIDRYLERGDPIELEPQGIVPRLLRCAGAERAYEIITCRQFARRGAWITGFFVWLPEQDVTNERLNQLYDHYERATIFDLFRDVDFLVKFERIDARVVPRIVEQLVAKAETDARVGRVLADTFDVGGIVAGRIRELFGGSPEDGELLKRAYFAACLGDVHFDYNAASFRILLDLDQKFGGEWIDWRYKTSSKGYISRYDESRDYSELWLRDDYAAVMRSILSRVQANQKFVDFSYAHAFITRRKDDPKLPEIRQRQKAFFLDWIARSADNANEMRFVFSCVSAFAADDRRDCVAAFVDKNKRFVDFQQLSLEANDWSWSGSAVPMLQGRVEFFEALIPLFDKIELLEHRKCVERAIAGLRKEIEAEKKSDFLRT